MTRMPPIFPDSKLAHLVRSRDSSFVSDVLAECKLGDGPALPANAFDGAKLGKRHARALLDYAALFRDSGGSSSLDAGAGVGSRSWSSAIVDILTAPVEAHPTTPLAVARANVRREVGWTTTLASRMLDAMLARYGKQWLADCHVVYTGHGTEQMLPFFPLCGALGLKSGRFRLSSASGDKGVHPLFNMIMANLTSTPARDFNLASRDAAEIVAELMEPRTVLLANGGQLLTGIDLPPEVLQRIGRGEIRFYLHNAADKKSYAELSQRYPEAFATAIAVNGADSVPKQLEFAAIGEQIAAHGDDASRRHNRVPINASTAVIFGVGAMGPAICQNLLSDGMPRDNIVLIDTDPSPEALSWAAERGLTIHHELPRTISGNRALRDEPHGVVFVATNSDSGLDDSHLGRLPESTVVINTNSEGRGVAVERIYAAYRNIRDADRDCKVYGLRDGDEVRYSDMVCERRDATGADRPKHLTFVNARLDARTRRLTAYSPNLSVTAGQDRLGTAVKVFVGLCYLADPDLGYRADKQAHPYPKEQSILFRGAAMPALTYQGPSPDTTATINPQG